MSSQPIVTSAVVNNSTTPGNDGRPRECPIPGSPRPSLAGIPEELLLDIIEFLKNDEDTLAQLCQTDKRCRRAAGSVLYKHISNYPPPSKKIRKLSRWPELSKNVRTWHSSIEDSAHKDMENSTFIRILENAHNIQDLTLRLCNTPRITTREKVQKSIDLFNDIIVLFDKATNRLAEPRNQFTQLTQITLYLDCHWGKRTSMDTLSILFRLPALIHLSLRNLRRTTPFRNWTTSASTSPIKSFILSDAIVDITAITQILASIKTLTQFIYEYTTEQQLSFYYDFNTEPRVLSESDDPSLICPEHSWKLLGQALGQHRNHLEALYIGDYSDPDIVRKIYPNGRDLGFLGSFADYPKLKKLGAPINALLDIETGESNLSRYLPEQLQYFQLHIQSVDPDTIMSCRSAAVALEERPRATPLRLEVNFTRLRRAYLRKSPRLYETLQTVQNSVFVTFWSDYGNVSEEALWDRDDLYETDTEDSEESSGEDEGESGDEFGDGNESEAVDEDHVEQSEESPVHDYLVF